MRTPRERQTARFADRPGLRQNADADGDLLSEIASPDAEGRALLQRMAERVGLSARGYHRVLRVSRTIADLEASDNVRRHHVAEALSYRLTTREPA